MGILSWLVLGLIAGFVGSKIIGDSGRGLLLDIVLGMLLLDIVLGIVGAFVGGFLFTAIGARGITGLNIWSMFVAIIGSVIVIWAYHALLTRL